MAGAKVLTIREATARGLSPSEVKQFFERGYVITEPLFDRETLAGVRAEIERVWQQKIAETAAGDARKHERTRIRPELQRLHRESPRLASFGRRPELIGIARSLLGADADLYWNQGYLKAPGGHPFGAIPWHQDACYADLDALVFNTWLAVTRTHRDNGTLWVAPRPIDAPVLPHVWDPALSFFRCDVDEKEAIAIELEPGQAVLYHTRVPHRSGVNPSGETRVAHTIAFSARGVRLRSTGEPFGDQIPVVRAHRTVDALLAELADLDGEAAGSAHPGHAVLAELAARVPGGHSVVATLFARYRELRRAESHELAEQHLGRLLALVPEDRMVNGDLVRARTVVEQLLDEATSLKGWDGEGARLLFERIVEIEPHHALALRELAATK